MCFLILLKYCIYAYEICRDSDFRQGIMGKSLLFSYGFNHPRENASRIGEFISAGREQQQMQTV